MSEAEASIKPLPPGAGLRVTPLFALHRELGAKLVPFAGYEMPLQYANGIVKEHTHVRSAAGFFDVSHMGQARLTAPDFGAAAAALERLVPGDIAGLKPGRLRYTQLLNESGGIIDDLMVTRDADGVGVSLVVNASRKEIDFAHIAGWLPSSMRLDPEPNRALIALQGPQAAAVLSRIVPGVEALGFMTGGVFGPVSVSRSGYTGEDGFEISVAADGAEALARRILSEPEVLPIGLGARDTLRTRSGPAPLRSGHGRDSVAGRGGADFLDWKAPPLGRRLPRRRPCFAGAFGRTEAHPGWTETRRPRRRASWHEDPRSCRKPCWRNNKRRLYPDSGRLDCDGLCSHRVE